MLLKLRCVFFLSITIDLFFQVFRLHRSLFLFSSFFVCFCQSHHSSEWCNCFSFAYRQKDEGFRTKRELFALVRETETEINSQNETKTVLLRSKDATANHVTSSTSLFTCTNTSVNQHQRNRRIYINGFRGKEWLRISFLKNLVAYHNLANSVHCLDRRK